MQEESRRLIAAAGALGMGLMVTSVASDAAELAFGVDVGTGYSDNIGRTSQGEKDETTASIGAELELDQKTTRLSAQVSSQLEYRDYLNNTFAGELVGRLVGNAQFDILDDRLSWVLEDTFGQATRNQLAPSTPGNRENVNFVTTGPNLTFPLTSSVDLRFEGRFSDVYYEDSPLGSERLRGLLGLQRDLSAASNVSLNVSVEQTEFDDMSAAEFDRQEIFLRYGLEGARTTVTLDAGYTQLEDAVESSDFLTRLSLRRRISGSASVALELGHEFSDAGNSFRQLQSGSTTATSTQPVQQVTSPFENNFAILRLSLTGVRSSIALSSSYFDEQYENQPILDRERTEIDLTGTRSLNSSVSLRAGVTYSRQQFDTLNRSFADKSAFVGADWRLGRTINLSLQYTYAERSDDVAASEYEENQVWLRFGYSVGNGESSVMGR